MGVGQGYGRKSQCERNAGSIRDTQNLGSLRDIPRGTDVEAGPQDGDRDPGREMMWWYSLGRGMKGKESRATP